MAVGVLNSDYTTKYYEFSYDDWSVDGDKLPKIGIKGKDNLNTIYGCCQGSYAIGTDGTVKVLNGDLNEWVDA